MSMDPSENKNTIASNLTSDDDDDEPFEILDAPACVKNNEDYFSDINTWVKIFYSYVHKAILHLRVATHQPFSTTKYFSNFYKVCTVHIYFYKVCTVHIYFIRFVQYIFILFQIQDVPKVSL